jgi:HPt (histidine-containing phosphotransfer) domain-containing protein
MTTPEEGFLRFLEEQRAEYRRGLPAKLEEMEAIVERIGAESPADLAAVERLAHSMAGSGGTFGFEALGRAAKALELCAQRLRQSGDRATGAQRSEIHGAVRDLRDALPPA